MADRSIAKPAPIPEDSIPKGEDYPPPADPPVTRQPVPVAFSSDDDDMISAILLIIITLFRMSLLPVACSELILISDTVPPVGVLIVAGCGADFCINLCLTILGFFPGHIHVRCYSFFVSLTPVQC